MSCEKTEYAWRLLDSGSRDENVWSRIVSRCEEPWGSVRVTCHINARRAVVRLACAPVLKDSCSVIDDVWLGTNTPLSHIHLVKRRVCRKCEPTVFCPRVMLHSKERPRRKLAGAHRGVTRLWFSFCASRSPPCGFLYKVWSFCSATFQFASATDRVCEWESV